MFSHLNKGLNNKLVFSLKSCRVRCLNSTTSGSSSDGTKSGQNKDKNRIHAKDNDFFGIFETNSKEISGLYDNSVDTNEVIDSYKDLVSTRESKMNEQNFLVTSFGRVRLDCDNRPKYHGQYDPDNRKTKFDIIEFEEKLNNRRKTSQQNEESIRNQTKESSIEENNIFDDQYFSALSESQLKSTDNPKTDRLSTDPQKSELGFIDGQYFTVDYNINPLVKSRIDFKFKQDFNQFLQQMSPELKSFESFTREVNQNISEDKDFDEFNDFEDNNSVLERIKLESPLKTDLFSKNFELNIETKEKKSQNLTEEEIKDKIKEQMEIHLEEEDKPLDRYKKPQRTGAQYLKDLQKGKESPKYPKLFSEEVKQFRSSYDQKGEKLDSKGYRILSSQVFDYTKLTHEDIIQLLLKSVLFDDIDILAINKPYGMSIHSKDTNSGPILTQYLEELSKRTETQKLYPVHRLDRDTTGVLLLAKTQEKAKELNRMFVDKKIIKRYLCITRGVPDEPEGVIDIPIDIGICDGKERMILRPEALEEYKNIIKPSKSAKRAVTQYKVLSEEKNAALIEVWPQTGVRHQIRVHLGFGLRCPILGDHKYSHLERIVPQKLTGDMLLALNVRQSKVRHIPLHLHAMQYCLPGTGAEGRNIFINAPIPHHFHKNMSRLRLRQ